jgi:hypothetical protein
LQKVKENEAMPRMPKPQSLRQGWQVHETEGQQACDEAQGPQGLLSSHATQEA